jgi:hypothetical protein
MTSTTTPTIATMIAIAGLRSLIDQVDACKDLTRGRKGRFIADIETAILDLHRNGIALEQAMEKYPLAAMAAKNLLETK